jgi:ArsR family transcriptional regulator
MLDNFVNNIKALSDPNRVRILNLLLQRELCVCEIMKILDINQPNASNHLNILKLNGFIKIIKKGRWSYYFINPKKEDLIDDILKLIKYIQDDEIILSDNQKLKNLSKDLCKIGG